MWRVRGEGGWLIWCTVTWRVCAWRSRSFIVLGVGEDGKKGCVWGAGREHQLARSWQLILETAASGGSDRSTWSLCQYVIACWVTCTSGSGAIKAVVYAQARTHTRTQEQACTHAHTTPRALSLTHTHTGMSASNSQATFYWWNCHEGRLRPTICPRGE